MPARRNPTLRALRAVLAHSSGAVGTVLVLVVVLGGLFAPVLTPYDPYRIDMDVALKPPGMDHPLGTDPLGRDVASRVLFGARFSLEVSVLSRLIAIALGTALGLVAGYFMHLISEEKVILWVLCLCMAFLATLMLVPVITQSGNGPLWPL